MRQNVSTFFDDRNIFLFFKGIGSVALFLTIVCCIGGGVPVHAAGGQPVIGLQPAYFDPHHPISRAYFIFNSTPGAHIQSAVRVINSGSVTGHATLYGTDATTGATSGAIYLDKTAKRQDVGSWLRLAKSSVTLAPGQSMIIPFQVTLPESVRPGQHLGGIGMEVTSVGQPKTVTDQQNKVQIHTRIITVIAVQVNLPGTPVEELSASGIQAGGENGYQSLQLVLHNTGTVMLKPAGTMEVMNGQGALLQTLPIKMDTFLPMTSIQYPIYLKSALGAGNYRIALTLNYGDHHILHYTTNFTITAQQVQQAFPTSNTLQSPATNTAMPWWMLAAGGFFVLCGLLFLIQQSRRFATNMREKRKGREGEGKGSHV
jgi:hypothetical protein